MVEAMSSTLEEVQMQETLIFSDTIKDLKMLKSQLCSAADYFELAYTHEEDKLEVMSNLKEYSVKALVNAVDHLGSISFKVSSLIDQRLDEVADADLRVSCIQQRAQGSQECMDREGLSQQSLVITAPKYHKRYILPAGDESMPNAVPNYSEIRKVRNRAAQMHQVFTADKRSDWPKTSRKPSLLKTSSVRVQATSEPKKLASLRSHADRNEDGKEGEQTPKKGKKFLKSLLSRRKSRKEEPGT
ncbi:hypothetical protein ABZP36_025175 [Zizania latifolia]